MKFTLLATLLAAFSFNAFAEELKIECEMNDIVTVRQFSLKTSFNVSENTFEDKDIDATLRLLGPRRETRDISVTREGNIVHYPAGQITKNPFVVITSVEKDGDVQLINLVVDFPAPFSSTIRLQSGETFNSTCKSVK